MNQDSRWMGAALALSERGAGRTAPNPNVGCIVEREGVVLGHGWTQPGGRPHAEAMALEKAGEAAKGARVHVTLEPCAHLSERGPACTELLIAAGVAAVNIAARDPDPRTAGNGVKRLSAAGIAVQAGCREADARAAMAGFFTRMALGRPRITLKLAMSIDGRTAMGSGESQWITGEAARRAAHLERARADVVLVGRGTLEADDPALDVRIEGLETRAPRPAVFSASLGGIANGTKLAGRDPIILRSLDELRALAVNDVLVEAGAGTASTLLAADFVDRLLIYRAPILIGDGARGTGRIVLVSLADAHGRWRLAETRAFGADRLEIYARTR